MNTKQMSKINKYEIKEPIWKDKSIGIADFRLKNDLQVDILYKNKTNERVFQTLIL